MNSMNNGFDATGIAERVAQRREADIAVDTLARIVADMEVHPTRGYTPTDVREAQDAVDTVRRQLAQV